MVLLFSFLRFRLLSLACLLCFPIFTIAGVPFVVLHGIGDQCSNGGIGRFVTFLSNKSSSHGICLEIGNGAADSWTMRLDRQVEEVCRKVKAYPELAAGFNIVGLSQGAVIGRGVIQWCDDAPPVFSLISIGGPHAGVASTPRCRTLFVCRIIDGFLKLGIYSTFVQDHVAPAGYVKIPSDMKDYLQGSAFLPRLNNEVDSSRNVTYAKRFASLKALVLIMFRDDTVIFPKETAQFGFFEDGTFDRLLQFNQTALYLEDWVGLRSLHDSHRVHFYEVPGDHLQITRADLVTKVVPFLK